MKKYVVKSGDTLYQISQKSGVRIPLLLASNPQIQNPGQLVPGQTIVIPELGKPAKGSVPGTGMPQKDGQMSVASAGATHKTKANAMPPYFGFVWPHEIQSGDSWSGLAKKYGVTKEQLQHVNPHMADSTTPEPGTMMYVPTSAFPIPAKGGGTHGPGPAPVMPQTTPDPFGTGMGDTHGPHTHHPHRGVQPNGMPSQTGPKGWFVDADDSASFLSSLDDYRSADRDGWSPPLSVRLGEDD